MLLIPAIDIKNGKCVRLRQGKMSEETVFSDDPNAMAGKWVAQGAKRLHIVDLDGASEGKPKNAQIIREITASHPDVVIQVGGGIRDDETIEAYLEMGVQFVILGTKAAAEPHFIPDVCAEFPGHIIIGLDAKDGKVAIDGWSKLSNHDVIDLAQHFEHDGVEAIVYTDIGRDGMLAGVNVEATVALARSIAIPVIASGGVQNLDDIRMLSEAADEGVSGVILGRSLYEGTVDLAAAQALVDELAKDA